MEPGLLKSEIEALRSQLHEAENTIEAIRRGEIDALVIQGQNGNEVYTLESADRTYRVFLEKMTEGAVTLNDIGVIEYSNSSFASMVSLTPALVVAELFQDFVRAEDRNNFILLLEQGWKMDVKGEVSLITDRGSIPVQLSVTALRLGKNFTLSILITDLTRQKEAQVQLKLKNDQLEASNLALELSNNDLQQFAYVASHDLQEPLRKILIYSNSIKELPDNELYDKKRIYVDKIISSATRLKILIIDILSYSRLSKDDINFEETDLKLLIHDVIQDMELIIEDKKAVLIVENLPVMPVIKAQIRQVFLNLISNALKFSKKGESPHIEIRSSNELDGFLQTEKFCHIHIKDNGIGFEGKYAKSIFNLFEKLHSKDDYEGTGIGLAICKKIIEKHHGHITVKTEQYRGSEFIISLPRHQAGIQKDFELLEIHPELILP
jgi:two-component system CheB/CheR fusion protein